MPSLEKSEEYAKEAARNWVDKKNDESYLQLVILDKNIDGFIGATSFYHCTTGQRDQLKRDIGVPLAVQEIAQNIFHASF